MIRRLSDTDLPRRGVSMFAQPRHGVFFGATFIVTGIVLMLVGLGLLSVQLRGADEWLLAVFGYALLSAGLYVLRQSVEQGSRLRRKRHMLQSRPGEPWLADYVWDPERMSGTFESSTWSYLIGTAFLVGLAAPFHWGAFVAKSGSVVWGYAAAAGVIDLLVLLAAYSTYGVISRERRFGPTSVRWHTFPLRRGEPIILEWQAGAQFPLSSNLSATIQLVEEFFRVSGTGKNRRSHLEFNCLYEQGLTMVTDTAGGLYQMNFTLPENLPPTYLSADTQGEELPRYYLLTIRLNEPAHETFKEFYLLPVY